MPNEILPAPPLARSEEEAARTVLGIIADVVRESASGARKPEIGLDTSLEREIGIDSLARVEVLLRIERAFGVRLPDQVLSTAESPRDLVRAAIAATGRPVSAETAATVELVSASGKGVPQRAATLVEVLDWHVAAHPERMHLLLLPEQEVSDGGQPMTYGELHTEAARFASGLSDAGVSAGQAVAIMLPTCREFFPLFCGILLTGAVPVPIYPPMRIAQLADHLARQSGILANCDARVLVTVAQAKRFAGLLRDRVPALARVVTPEDLTGGAPQAAHRADARDLAFLQYTSGSTGNPKGVMLSHENLLANIRAMGRAAAVDPGDVFVSWLPLYHDMGLIGAWMGSLYYALPLVVMPPTAFLSRPARWLRAIHRYRGTLSSAPNFAYEICATRVDDGDLTGLDLSCWRMAFNGAEPVSEGTMTRFAGRFAPYGLRRSALAPVYGLAECAVGLTFPPPGRGLLVDRVERAALSREGIARPARADDPDALRFVACGSALPDHEIRIADPSGGELPERAEGRVEFRGPSATGGYLRNPEADRGLFDGDWLDTGDLGYIAGGELYVTGRAKDVIIRGGRHLHPQELEESAGSLPGIRKGCVAVFGAPDPASGTEKVVVLAETRVTDRARQKALRAALADLAASLLGAPADDIVLAPPHTVLKTSSGKIRRAASREMYLSGRIGSGRAGMLRQSARFAGVAARARLARSARAAARGLYAAYAWALFAALSLAVLGVCALPRAAWRRRSARVLDRAFVRAAFIPLHVRGLENFPSQGSVTVVANHSSYLDAILLFAALPERCRFVAKRELRDAFAIGRVLQALDVRFVERFDLERSAADARRLADLARGGESLVFFPEGTFTRAPGLRSFHMGAFLASAEAGVPVLPVAIRGTRSVLRDGQWLPRRGAIEIAVGPLLHPEQAGWAAAAKLRALAREAILARCGEPDRGEG